MKNTRTIKNSIRSGGRKGTQMEGEMSDRRGGGGYLVQGAPQRLAGHSLQRPILERGREGDLAESLA